MQAIDSMQILILEFILSLMMIHPTVCYMKNEYDLVSFVIEFHILSLICPLIALVIG